MRIHEIITESTDLDEGWKSKLGAAALAGAAALGGGHADAQTIRRSDGSYHATTIAQQRQIDALAKQKAEQEAAARAAKQSASEITFTSQANKIINFKKTHAKYFPVTKEVVQTFGAPGLQVLSRAYNDIADDEYKIKVSNGTNQRTYDDLMNDLIANIKSYESFMADPSTWAKYAPTVVDQRGSQTQQSSSQAKSSTNQAPRASQSPQAPAPKANFFE